MYFKYNIIRINYSKLPQQISQCFLSYYTFTELSRALQKEYQ